MRLPVENIVSDIDPGAFNFAWAGACLICHFKNPYIRLVKFNQCVFGGYRNTYILSISNFSLRVGASANAVIKATRSLDMCSSSDSVRSES